MAVTANSLDGGSVFRGPQGSYPDPVTLPGFINAVSTSVPTGSTLTLVAASGLLIPGGEDPVAANIAGWAAPVSPRRVDQTPLTSATAPASALPNQHTTPSSGAADLSMPDEPDFVVPYYPALSGTFMTAHTAGTVGNGTDIRADADTDLFALFGYTVTVASGPAGAEITYATPNLTVLAATGEALITQSVNAAKIVAYEPFQPDSLTGSAFNSEPGSIVENGGGTGTFNPRCIFIPMQAGSLWI